MTDFLLELRSEEIPARMQAKARGDLRFAFETEVRLRNLHQGMIETYSTPRRLVLIARDLAEMTEATSEERKGPRVGAPEQALAGFLRSTGLTRDQLTERDGVLFATIEKPGRPTADVLAEAIPEIVRAFPWPKSMRWGAASISTESPRWVRPLQGVAALFGKDIVPFEIAGVTSAAATLGHRFHHPGPITIGSASDYIENLRACHVIVDHAEREALIRDGAARAATAAGLTLIEDEGLVVENAGLTEWPVPLLGRFDAAYLDVPPEVIQLTMRTNQKYFACTSAEGQLTNAFVCTANIDASDGGAAVIDGNRKVLAARLADAKFFWDNDLKVPLDEQAEKLKDIVFHEKLGTVADKVERVAKLAEWLATEHIVPNCEPALAKQAARLSKADLVTGMVGEFPELQGIIGGHLARAQGEPDAVADAIRDHYKPVGQGDDVPTAPVTVAVSLADKLDTIFSFFSIDELPTGSKDPFALRRQMIAVVRLALTNILRFNLSRVFLALGVIFHEQYAAARALDIEPLIGRLEAYLVGKPRRDEMDFIVIDEMIDQSMQDHLAMFPEVNDDPEDPFVRWHEERRLGSMFRAYAGWHRWFVDWQDVLSVLPPAIAFANDRLKVQQREAGVRHDLIDAVFALGGEDDLVRLLARVRALQAFVGTGEGANLLAGYKRAGNILKKEGYEPLPFGGGDGGGDSPRVTPPTGSAESPHPNPSPEGEGLEKPLSYTPEPAETALVTALDTAAPAAAAAVAREDFEGAMQALSTLRAPIDAFFDTVTVNDPDPAKRAARLALLARVRDAVHRVADFSKIEG